MTIQAFMKPLILRSKHTNGQLTACLLLNNSFFTPGWEEKLNGSWRLGNPPPRPCRCCQTTADKNVTSVKFPHFLIFFYKLSCSFNLAGFFQHLTANFKLFTNAILTNFYGTFSRGELSLSDWIVNLKDGKPAKPMKT